MGLVWIALWWWTTSRVRPLTDLKEENPVPPGKLVGDPRLWAVALAFCMVNSPYMLWAQWTTIYLVQERRLVEFDANAYYAWFPPLFSVLGGFLGGGLSFRWIRQGSNPVPARMKACWLTAPLLVAASGIPLMPSAGLAAVAIGMTYLSLQSLMGNISCLPVDWFGGRSAGLGNSILASVAAVTQMIVAPAIGAVVDRVGFGPLCMVAPLFPVAGLVVLQTVIRRQEPAR
jgi:sugar phosphate permease